MISDYITFNLNPLPCISVSDKILPPDILFKIFVVACPTFGFLVFAETAMPINGAVALIAGFKNFVPSCLCSLKYFIKFTFNRTTFEHTLMRCKRNDFLAFTFKIGTFVMEL